MIVAIASATSQNTDTVIRFGDRLPYLYYWDTNWIDRYMETNPEIYNYAYYYHNYRPDTGPGRSVFIGRACMTSKPLKIIGIAGHARIGNINPEDPQLVHGVSATVDISGLAHGTYIVRITTPSGTTTKRIVKK